MKNDFLKMTKINSEENAKEFYKVPISLNKKEFEKFKKYDEDIIAKVIACSIYSIDPEILEKSKGIKIQLFIQC